MKTGLLIFCFLFFVNYPIWSQDVPGLSYCLLFDSNLEKQAFQKNNEYRFDPLIFLMAHDPEIDSTKYVRVKTELYNYSKKLSLNRKRFNTDVDYLRHVFNSVHKKYLKSYDYPESFNGIFNKGRYNCVSGVALYACLLSYLGYSQEIYETRFHVFLIVNLKDSTRIMFETTDPLNGFVVKECEIEERINEYLTNEKEKIEKSIAIEPYSNRDALLQEVTLEELSGLHYYNLAVNYVNEDNYLDALRALKKATLLYPKSERINQLLKFVHSCYDAELSIAFH